MNVVWWLLEKTLGIKHPSQYLSFVNLEDEEAEQATKESYAT
jgi:hypothetical protein